jgi:hypothetical protein
MEPTTTATAVEPAESLPTFAQVVERSGYDAGGVRLYAIGEEGEWIVASGHIDPQAMRDAAMRYAKEYEGWGEDDWPDAADPDVLHTQGRLGWPKPGHHPDSDWWLDWTGSLDEDALTWGPLEPITVLDRS